MNINEFFKTLEIFEKDRGIDKQIILDALSEALQKSYCKHYDLDPPVFVDIDTIKSTITISSSKTIVEEVEDYDKEISLLSAQRFNKDYKIGDTFNHAIDASSEFGRLAAMQTKQILRQKIREAEKDVHYNQLLEKKDEILSGIVERIDKGYSVINLGFTTAILPINNQMPNEHFQEGEAIRVYISNVEKDTKGPKITLTRNNIGFLKRLFELEVPEIIDGIIEIKAIARDAGERSKVAVYSNDTAIEAVGTCIGVRGRRVNVITEELNGERIDVISWDKDLVVYIANALSPAEVVSVILKEDERSATVIVRDGHLSLAIGKRGQNSRLAVKLVGMRLDIKSEKDAKEAGIEYSYNVVREDKDKDKQKLDDLKKRIIKKELTYYEDDVYDLSKPLDKLPSNPKHEEQGKPQNKKVKDLVIPPIPSELRDKTFRSKDKDRKKEKSSSGKISRTNKDSFRDKPDVDKRISKKERDKELEDQGIYLPIYTEEELLAFEEEEIRNVDDSYEEIDYDQYDSYYDKE